jgi:Cu/Ag efflux protein CusF
MKHITTAVLIIALAYPLASTADSSHHPASASQAELSDGEVRRIDKDAKKITIRHGPLKNLDMPPMTMVFQVKDPAMLDQVKAGDKIRFSAEKTGGAYTVTTLQPAK